MFPSSTSPLSTIPPEHLDDSEPSESDGPQGVREARALAEIVQHINQSLELDRVFALIARHAAELLRARASRLGMLEGDEIVLVGTFGDMPAPTIGTRVPLSASVAGEVVHTRRSVRISDIAADGRWPWTVAHSPPDARNALVAPLLVGNRPIGAIGVHGRMDRDFDEHDETLLFALANHAAIAIENARLYRASVRTMRRATILANAAHSLATHIIPQAMYADIARIAQAYLGANGLAIYQADRVTQAVQVSHAVGLGWTAATDAAAAFWRSANEGVISGRQAQFRVVIVPSPEGAAEHALAAEGVAAIALVPLIVEGQPRGVMVLCFRIPQPFDDDQRQLLVDFGATVAVAVRNALLLERMEQRGHRLAAVAKVQQAISAAASLDAVYAQVYRAVASVIDAPCFTLMRYDEEEAVFVPEYVVNDGVPVDCARLPRIPLGVGATTQAFSTGDPNIVGRSPRGWTGEGHELPGAGDVAVVLSAPIVHGEQVLGVMQAQSYRSDAYDWDDVDLIMLIARQAGTAIARARMLEAERTASERERTLAIALETMDQPVFICTPTAHIQYANGAAAREYGYSRDEFVGMNEARLSIRPDRPIPDEMRQSVRDRGVWAGERLQRRKDGSEFPAWVTVSSIRDADGRETASVVSVRNLSEERRVAEQLRQSEKLVALGELVAGVAHEVNNPLTGISAFAQLLQEDNLTSEQLEAAQMIKREADRAVHVIRDLLIFARKTGPHTVSVDLNDLVEQTLRLRTYGLRTAGVRVELDLAPDLQRLRGDDRQLQQVLLNLVVNAEHAMAAVAERTLRITTRNAVERVVVEVSDSGTGMTPEVQKRIFEPFFTTKPEGKGTGLGLSVSYGIVQTHGGTLTVHSAPGAGATFRLSFRADAEATARAREAAAAESPDASP